MTKPVVNALKLAFVCIGILLCLFKTAKAQVPTIDSAGLKLIKISHTDSIRKYEGKLYMSFLGAVVIEHDGIVMNCDSAHLFSEKKKNGKKMGKILSVRKFEDKNNAKRGI